MRLSNSNAVDFLGLEKATGHIVLTLVDDCDWNDELQHLVLLQAKLNRYLDFFESGEVYKEATILFGHRVDESVPTKLSILAQYEPTEEGLRFLERANDVAQQAGMLFSFKVLLT